MFCGYICIMLGPLVDLMLLMWHLVNTGSRLVQCGELEQKLGEARREFIAAATKDFLEPLHTFLEGDMKTVQVRWHNLVQMFS